MSAWFWVSLSLYVFGFVMSLMWHYDAGHGRMKAQAIFVNLIWPLTIPLAVLVGGCQYLSDRKYHEHL